MDWQPEVRIKEIAALEARIKRVEKRKRGDIVERNKIQ